MLQLNPVSFPIVCVGGAAGEHDAYVRLLRHLPCKLGAAIVIASHVGRVSAQLRQTLLKCTDMPVRLITDGLDVVPDHVFIMPAYANLHVLDGAFRLTPMPKPLGWPDLITACAESLTHDWCGQLVAVIVSGYDGDGAAALGGIKDMGGITIAQEPDAAGTPFDATDSFYMDFILSPEDIVRKIVSIARYCSHSTHKPAFGDRKPVATPGRDAPARRGEGRVGA